MSGGRHRQKTLIPPLPPAREYPHTPSAPSRIGDAWTSQNLTSSTENHPGRDLLNQSNMSLILRIIRRQQVTDKMRRHDHISGEFDASPLPVREILLQLEARVPAVSRLRRGLQVARLIPMMTPAQFQPAKNTSGLRSGARSQQLGARTGRFGS